MLMLRKLGSFLAVTALVLSLGACHKGGMSVPVAADAPCADLAGLGFPEFHPKQAGTQFICHEGYALEYNPRSKTPMWVVEHLTRDNLDQKNATRLNNFRPDPYLNVDQASLQDFAESGYDRGHMAPAEDFRKSVKQMSESFFLSNMVPQNPDNNRHIWAQLEKNVRGWATRYGEVYVITGPIFYQGQSLGSIGRNKVAVPTHLYKVILAPHQAQAIAFIIPNAPEDVATLDRFEVPVNQVEQLTGLQFFPRLDPTQAQEVKARIAPWQLIHGRSRASSDDN